jgi:hypothetical protein
METQGGPRHFMAAGGSKLTELYQQGRDVMPYVTRVYSTISNMHYYA